MHALRRLLLGVAATVAMAVIAMAFPLHASAHALLTSSDPSQNADLSQSPRVVIITFGEAPDPRFSSIMVLSATGQTYSGPTMAVPGNPVQLQVAVRTLPRGLYTVNWRTFSNVDGHVAGGSFSFGVQESPAAVPASQPAAVLASPGPTAADIAGRLVLFAGLVVMVGSAAVGVVVLPRPPRAVMLTLPPALAAATLGTATVLASQFHNAGAGLGDILSTSLGTALVERAVPLALAAAALTLCLTGGETWRRRGLALVGVAGLLGMLADVLHSHAAAGSAEVANVAVQFIHIGAVGVWLGGLLALLLALRGLEGEERGRAVRRFSTAAGVALVTVAATGTVRALVEVRAWDGLWQTTFGRLVIAKVSLLALLAGLGAVNRYRHVPVASRVVTGLRRVGTVEVTVAAGALLVAATLVNEAPPTQAAAQTPAPPQTVSCQPGGGGLPTLCTINLRVAGEQLQVYLDPETPGNDQFHMTYFDASGNGVAVIVSSVVETPPGGGPIRLAFRQLGPGHYVADATVRVGSNGFDITGVDPQGRRLSAHIDMTAR